jgi:cob(I)alamin adenosyltransferase
MPSNALVLSPTLLITIGKNMSEDDIKSDKHKARMQKVKDRVDARVDAAKEECGLLIVITGNGKGKSTSGFGTLTRAVGHGLSAAAIQFIKGTWDCGERNVLEKLDVPFHVMATGFTWNTQDKSVDIAAAKAVWVEAKKLLADESVDVVLLDELTYMLSYKYLDLDEVLETIANRPEMQHVIVTGRGAHRSLIEMADTVSEVQSVKHAFDNNIKAQKGIDW